MALLIQSEDLRGLLSVKAAISAVRQGFQDHKKAPHYSSPRIRMQHEDRRVTIHPGGCVSLETAGVFIHTERFTFHNQAQQYTNAGKRVYVAYDSETAELKTIIVGSLPFFDFDTPNEQFATETAITSAVGTDLLARGDCKTLAMLGTGRQARRHLIALSEIRPLEEVKIYSRSEENRETFKHMMSEISGLKLTLCVDAKEAVSGADLICCATGSNIPALEGEWLTAGQHITSIVNSNKGVKEQAGLAQRRREIDDKVVERSDIIAVNLIEQSIIDEHGDLFEPVERGILKWSDLIEIGELIDGSKVGRTSSEQITLYKQNSDQGVGYMALAKLAHDVALENGIGIQI